MKKKTKLTRKTLAYMGKADDFVEGPLTEKQTDYANSYYDIVERIQKLVSKEARLAVSANEEIQNILTIMKKYRYPQDDISLFSELANYSSKVAYDLQQWKAGEAGTNPMELEEWFGLPYGTFAEKSIKSEYDRFTSEELGNMADALNDMGREFNDKFMLTVTKYGLLEIDKRLERLGYSQAEISDRIRKLAQLLREFDDLSVRISTDILTIMESKELDIFI